MHYLSISIQDWLRLQSRNKEVIPNFAPDFASHLGLGISFLVTGDPWGRMAVIDPDSTFWDSVFSDDSELFKVENKLHLKLRHILILELILKYI